ncbi:MAG: glycosyltransferase family 4 protein [Mariprofundus sp.]
MLNLLYIVRRYGPVGGMERYVWEVSRELASMGHHVTVLCEALYADAPPAGITVVALGQVRPKPRWLAHLRFSHRVTQWVALHPDPSRIIHSHERTAVHQLTTFHGPPFAQVKDKPLWKRISPRIAANLWLERRELCGPQVKAVIPNSPMIAASLLNYYPEIAPTLVAPITPGVADIPIRANHTVAADGGVIAFVGKEWQRKGLDIAIAIVRELRTKRPALRFLVIGPKPEKILHLFRDWHDGFELLGERDTLPLYASFDLLLHPARQEPYGMVIAEARAAAVPVLVSSNCGISDELAEQNILNLDDSAALWAKACDHLLTQKTEIVIHSWRAVALEQLACYRNLSL